MAIAVTAVNTHTSSTSQGERRQRETRDNNIQQHMYRLLLHCQTEQEQGHTKWREDIMGALQQPWLYNCVFNL